MKKVNYYVLCVLSFLLTGIVLTSCEKFLDKTPDDTVSEEVAFADFRRVSGMVTSIYDRLREWDRGVTALNAFSLSTVTDECKASTVENDLANRIARGTYGPSITTEFSSFWWNCYQAIRECNTFFEGVEKYKTPDNPYRRGDLEVRKGEAYFLRAYWHYRVLCYYGDMVYMDKTADLDNSNELKYVRISGVDAIDRMIADCEAAIQRLPVNHPVMEIGRAEKGTAMALKAKLLYIRATHMWNGGGPEGITFSGDNRVNKEKYAAYDPTWWKKAADAAKEVMDLKRDNGELRYNLYQTGGVNEFTPSSRNMVHRRIKNIYHDASSLQNEYIFILTRNKDQGWQIDQTPPTNGGGARSMPLQDQVDEYEFIGSDGKGYPIYHENAATLGYDDENPYVNRDPRFYADIMYHGCTFQATTDPLNTDRTSVSADRIGANNASVTGYYLRKMLRDDWVVGTGGWHLHYPLIRLPEIQLIYCEGMCRFSGASSEIVGLVNNLRARSFMAPIPDGLDQAGLLEYIERERRVELFYENVRYFDARWKLEPSSTKELARQTAYDALPADQKANFYPYPRTGKQIHGMEPVRDPNGKIEINGVKYRMQRFVIEQRKFNIPQMYFLPLSQVEINNCPTIQQNPGW